VWNRPSDLESRIADDIGGVYFDEGNALFGLTSVSVWPNGRSQDDTIATMARVMNDVLGQPGRGAQFTVDYHHAWSDLDHDLHRETLDAQPSVIRMVAFEQNWSHLNAGDVHGEERVGVSDGTRTYRASGRESDVERILAMNPDFIFLAGESPETFYRDPRWAGMTATKTRHVYSVLDGFMDWPYAIDNVPLAARRIAEIVHPERMQPKLREIMRNHYIKAYSYQLSDNEVDDLLRVKENRLSAGYARFTRDYSASGNHRIRQ
jgi:hypothetical protein